MKYLGRRKIFLLFFIIFCVFFTQEAFAYLDPGSGSFIIQLLIGFLLGGLYAIKLFWKQIKTFFVNLFSRKRK